MAEVSLTVAEYLQAKTKFEAAKQQLDDAQDRLIKEMEADQRKSFRWVAGGVESKLTYVQQHQTFIDEPGLRRALKAKVFDRYTKRVLDRKAMELAMDAGEVDPITVSRFVTTRPKKPFLTYTEKETE
jgi:phosphoenolpyruvate-protein kinase (PTS system EI component)